MSRRSLAALVLPLSLVLAGCAGTEAPDAAEPTPAATSTSGSPPEGEGAAESSAPAVTPAGTELAVQVAGGQVTGDTGRVPVPLGDRVTITITSDAADSAHLHGYDVTVELPAGTPADLVVDATIPGVFELELHDSGTVLLTLQVS